MDANQQVTRELTDQERARLTELDEAIAKFEGQKRWSDVIKSIIAKADIVVDRDDKIALLSQAGQMYLEKSSNQAEAIKCFEQVIELDPHNIAALTSLKEMYEKRRDWEKLVRAMEREAELLDPADRGLRYVEMAQLATERLRKPEICIDLWQKVLAYDAENRDALGALGGLYERAREWKPLADVLEKQSSQVAGDELKTLLGKLGMIYADKLNDDHGAVSAFQRLLAIDPEDRRAQEQLKRRYVAIKAWDDLEAFYAATGKYDELIRTLEREAQNKDAGKEEQIDLMFRVARLWMTQEKADRAAKAYEKVLDLDPESHDAAVALAPLYEAAGDAKKLAHVIEVRLRHVTEPGERIVLLREVGVLYEEKLRRQPDAFARYLEAFALDPMRDILREDIARLAPAVNGWDQVIAAYAKAIEASSDPEQQIDLRLQLGGVLVAVDKVEDAIAQYRAVYDASSDHMGAIEALERLYRQTGQHAALLEVYDRRMELEQDPEQRRRMAYGRASLLENELADLDRAIEAYQSILVEWGDDEVDAYGQLDILFERQGRWSDLAGTLERRIDLGPATDDELASLKFRLATVLERHLSVPGKNEGASEDNKPRALELLREVVTLMPEHDGARLSLERMLTDAQLGVPAAQILEPIYEARNDWPSLIRALEVLVAGAEEPERKLELLTKIGDVAVSQLNDAAQAFGAYGRALRAVPENEESLERLEAIALDQNRFGDLVALVSELAAEVGDPALARRLWIRAARMHDTQLGSVDNAVAAYTKILDQDPGDIEVLDALEELYRRAALGHEKAAAEPQRYRDLVGVLRRKAELAGELEAQEALLAQVADIHEQMLGEPAAAISIYREILELDPESRTALGALDRLFEKQALWSDLADNIGRQLSISADPEEQTQLMLRLASLRETRMSAVEAAIEIYREVLGRDQANAEALGALERLLQVPAHQPVITDILEPYYREANEYEKLIGVHEIQATIATSPERSSPEKKVELLHRIAELYEIALDNAEKAFESFARALGEDPSNTTTQEQLERLAGNTGDYAALASTYEQRVSRFYEESETGRPAEEETALAALLLTKAAEIREERLADVETAIAHHQRVLDLDAAHLGAASSLERLFQQTERYEPLAQILLLKAGMLDVPDEQKEHLFRAAAIYEELLERPLDAISVYSKVLEVDAEELAALDKLIELYLRLEKWPELLDIYTRKADVVADPEEKKRLYLEVGAVYERELGDGIKAIDTYQRILEIDPDDLTAIGRLDALYQAAGNWQELRQILEREADLAGDPSEVISYKFRIADLYDHKLDDPQRAVDGYQEILNVVPDHQPTLDALEAMIAAKKLPVAAALVLEPVYQQAGEWAKLVAALEVQVAYADDPPSKVDLLHRVAGLQEVQLDNAKAAFDAYARALPFDNAHEDTLGNLERLAADLDTFGEVARLYDIEIERLVEDPGRRVELALRLAPLYEVQLGDVDSAIVRYNIVLSVEAEHPTAIEALDRLYEHTGRWNELAAILGKEIQLAGSPEQMLDFQFRLGQVYQRYLSQIDRAIEQYKEILNAAPEHASALEALEALFAEGVQPLVIAEILEPLYRMQEAWERLIGVHQVGLEFQNEAAERVAMMHRIAEIAEERAAEPQIAFEWHQRVLLEDPLNERSTEDTERLAGQLGNWEQLSSTLADVLEQRKEPEVRVPVGKRLARIYENELSDVARAVEAHLFVLGADPKEIESLEALDRIYSEHGASEALQEILARRIAATTEERDLVELHFRRAQVLENDLGRIDEAVTVYLHLLDKLDAENEGAIKSLLNIYTEKQAWPLLFGAFERELKIALGDSGRADVLAKMARLAEDHLRDDKRAITLWKEVLELRGEDPEALNALGDLYAKGEAWSDLVEILDREAAIAPEDEQRVKIYGDLGRVYYAKLRKEREAIDSWQRVLDIDPTNTNALFALIEIYRASNQTQELVDNLNRVIEVGTATLDEVTLETCYMQLGELYERTLQQPSDAVYAYNKALELNPRNFVAMDALEGIHTTESQWVEKIEVMEKRVSALDEAPRKIDVLLAIAQTWADKQEEPDSGTSAYERILQLDPRHEFAFKRLDELHREAGRWEPLVEMYITRTETAESNAERVDLLRNIAKVQDERLGDKLQAFDTLLLAWEEDYTDRQTADELEEVTAATRKWNDLLNAANSALTATTVPAVKIAISLRCAKWYADRLNHPQYAIPYYQQIQALDPTNVEALQQLAGLYRNTQQWQPLAQQLGAIVGLATDPHVKATTYLEMGDLCQTHLNIPQQSRTYYLQALEAEPQFLPALEALDRVYRTSEEWPELLDIQKRRCEALIAQGADAETILEARLGIAETYEYKLKDADNAIDTYKVVLETDAVNLRALKGLERLYALKSMWPELLEILEKEFDVVQTEKERIEILHRVAAMWEEHFAKRDKAAERLERLLEIDPSNDPALRSLERIYRQLQRWDDLINTYDRHIQATPDRSEKQDLYAYIGEVYGTELNDVDRAIDAYLNILSINADNTKALEALSRLYERRGDHSQALDSMMSLVRLLSDPRQVVDLRFRMGKMLDEQLGDRASAVEQYQSALDVEPGHLESLEAMRKIHLDAGDWLAAAKSLEQEAAYQQQPRVVSRLLVELGKLYDERLEEHERAIEMYENALKQDEDNEDAALPLSEEYMKLERWRDALPLLDSLVKRSGKREPAEQHRLSFMLGEAALKSNQLEDSIRALTKANQLDPQHLPTLMMLSNAYYQTQSWDQAFKFYQMILVQHRDAISKEELTDVFYRLGVVKREQGDRRKALNMFDKALEEDAQHRPTLEAMVGLYQATNDWEQVIHYKKRILELTEDEERFNMLEEIGDLWHEKLKNAQKAIQSYNEAAEIKPKDHKILHKLLGLYQSSKQWDQGIEIIERISAVIGEQEGSEERKKTQQGRYTYTIGVILRDEVKDADRALQYFDRALDYYCEIMPADLDAKELENRLKGFKAINEVLTAKKDWKQLERAYRKMLKRVTGKGHTGLEFNFWHTLGVIYRDRLKQTDHAVEAFRMAVHMQPDNAVEHQILAELYSVVPGRTEDAIAENQWLLRYYAKQDKMDQDAARVLQALYKLYFDARQYDKAWCVAATLTFLKGADAEQAQFYEQYKPKGMIKPTARVDDESWLKDLTHPEQDLVTSKIFAVLWPAVLSIKGKPDKEAGVTPKYQVDPANSTVTLARSYGSVAQVLGIQIPRLFLRQDVPAGLTHLPIYPLGSLAGSALLQGYQPNDLVFICGRHLTDYRPEHYIRTLLPSNSELKVVLMAALAIAGLVPATDPAVAQTIQALTPKLTPAQIDALRTLGKRFAGATDIKRWLQCVELTACRAGFLLCNDLDTARRMIQALGAAGPVDVAPREKIKELVLFSVSEEYFRLRQTLGIQLNVA